MPPNRNPKAPNTADAAPMYSRPSVIVRVVEAVKRIPRL